MKKLFFTMAICLFTAVTASSSTSLPSNSNENLFTVNCFGEWTAAYNGALAAGFTTEAALEIANRVFDQCAFSPY